MTKWIAGFLVLVAGACKGGGSPVAPDASSRDASPSDAAVHAPADAPADAAVSPFSFVPASLDFGYVAPGTVSPLLHLAINNRSSAEIPDFALSFSGDDAIELHVSQTTCTSTLGTGGCQMQLDFAPHADGDHTMAITAMAPGQLPASASIHAVGGLAPHPFGPTVSYLDFGTVVVGSTGSQVVTYTNSGSTTLPPISFAFAGESPDQYHLEDDTCTGVQLPPNATCTVTVVYAPTAWMTPGAAILYGTAVDTSELDLRAQASPATTLSISPPSYDFGNVGPAASASVPFTITNTGGVAATGFELTMYNPQFVVASSTCTAPVAPGASCPADVQLVPTGSHFARIHATSASNDAIAHLTADATPAEPPLTGTGQ